ncbi:MAG: lysophospholipid acyltransferase family protein [Paracoccaceae bacterium]|nr:lysophospholipid acyltransferase family protein [Paracoccaceae bacterium]
MAPRKNNLLSFIFKITFLLVQFKKYVLAFFKLLVFMLLTLILLPLYLIAQFVKKIKPGGFDFCIRSLWSKFGLWLCNVRVEVHGSYTSSDLYVCNHVSWLDILVLQSILNISFVAKSEVKQWPVFGFLAYIADTVFIERRAVAAKRQQSDLVKFLQFGKRLCLFPEGTSTDGSYVLPFKSALFEVFVSLDKKDGSAVLVQPVSLVYHHSDLANPTIFGWWGDMNLINHIFNVVANVKSGTVKVTFEEPIDAKKIGDRKKLALAAESLIKKRFAS